jgi:hypothetical protein
MFNRLRERTRVRRNKSFIDKQAPGPKQKKPQSNEAKISKQFIQTKTSDNSTSLHSGRQAS